MEHRQVIQAYMTHPSLINFFVLSLCSVFLGMFVRLRAQGFDSSVNKVFQREMLVNSKMMFYSPI